MSSQPTGWLARLKFRFQDLVLRYVLANLMVLAFRALRPAKCVPSYTKTYRNALPDGSTPGEIRVFLPDKKGPEDLPPLVIDIHAGGFILGAPLLDDTDNHILSKVHGFCVVSIPYRLAPKYKFPTAIHDCEALIHSILKDDSIPFAKDKPITLIGYSAGACLTLSISQLPSLRQHIGAVVSCYPNIDFDEDLPARNVPHMLIWQFPIFRAAYIPPGVDSKDPLVSPRYAKRSDLCKNICMISCEQDVLQFGQEEFMEELAEHEDGKLSSVDGGWEKGGLRWVKLEGVDHGYNMAPRKWAALQAKQDAMHAGITEWLYRKVYSSF